MLRSDNINPIKSRPNKQRSFENENERYSILCDVVYVIVKENWRSF